MSPRLYPFTFFSEDRDVLGTPHRLNTKARAAFPTFFDSSAATHLAYVNDNPPGSGDIVRYAPLPPIPSGTPADPFLLDTQLSVSITRTLPPSRHRDPPRTA